MSRRIKQFSVGIIVSVVALTGLMVASPVNIGPIGTQRAAASCSVNRYQVVRSDHLPYVYDGASQYPPRLKNYGDIVTGVNGGRNGSFTYVYANGDSNPGRYYMYSSSLQYLNCY